MLSQLRKAFASSKVDFHSIFGFSPELLDIRAAAKDFAKKEVAPIAAKTDIANKFPDHLWKKFGEMGFLGVTVPSAYGGIDLQQKYTAHSIIMEEISRASGSIGLSYGADTALCIAQVYRHGNQSQRKKYLPKLCSGQFIGALSMSEPNAGSDVMSMKTKAVKEGSQWVINGNKMWCTNGPTAHVFVVYAKTSEKKLTAFLVEKDTKGFSTAQKLDKLGMRGSDTCQLILQNVRVPEENVLGQVGKGSYVLMSGLDYERLVLAAGPCGIMQAAFDQAHKYSQVRQQFGKKIGEFQLISAKLAEMLIKLQTSRAYLYSVSRKVDKGHLSNLDCSAVIYHASKCATQVALDALQIHGGNGYTNDYPLGRMVRDAKLYEIGAGTQQIRLWLIGRKLFESEPSD